jgi:hypothetical protein
MVPKDCSKWPTVNISYTDCCENFETALIDFILITNMYDTETQR